MSADRAVSDAARERSFKTLIPKLEAADAKALDKDIAAILDAFKDEQPIRLQASGLLAGLALRRADGSEALRRAVPVFLSQFRDQNQRVRENAIRSIVSLRPEVPSEALGALLPLVREDRITSNLAIYGLARFAPTSPVATNELVSLLSAVQPVETRRAVIQSIGYVRLDNPVLIGKLGEILGDSNRELVKEVIRTLSMIGPPAAAAKAALQRIADTDTDKELSSAATAAMLRMEAKK